VASTRSWSGGRSNARQELLDLFDDRIGVSDVGQVVDPESSTSLAPGM
jgi:hypothetical protein